MAQALADILDLPARMSEMERTLTRLVLQMAELAGDDKDLLTAEQAAEFLGMTTQAVRRAATRGTIPAVRLGRRLRFERAALRSRLR